MIAPDGMRGAVGALIAGFLPNRNTAGIRDQLNLVAHCGDISEQPAPVGGGSVREHLGLHFNDRNAFSPLRKKQGGLTAHLTAADDGDFLPGRRRITEDFRGGNGRLPHRGLAARQEQRPMRRSRPDSLGL